MQPGNPILAKKPKQITKALSRLYNNKELDEFIRQVELLILHGYNLEKLSTDKLPLQEKYDDMKQMMTALKNHYHRLTQPDAAWNRRELGENSSISVKMVNTTVEIKYEAVLNANIENLCIMLYLTKLYSQFIPFCQESIDLQQVSPLQKIAFLRFKIPFISDRCGYFHGMGIDRIEENGTIVICGEGMTNNGAKLQKYKIDPREAIEGAVVMDLKYFICEISHLKEGFLFRSWAQIDSHMPLLPGWVVNLLMKQVGGYVIEKIVKMTRDLSGTVWQKEVKENYGQNEKFYKWLHRRIEHWKTNKSEKAKL